MQIGVMMHCTDVTITPAELAVAAEERGFESMFVTEHTHIPVRQFIEWWGGQPMPEEYKRLHDPIVALATAGAVTSRIKLGTGVLVLGQREPLATAKQLASLDRLTGGRLICGVGYGWERDELAHHGIAWAERRAAWREHVQAVRVLWTDDEAAFAGNRVRFAPSWSYPKPLQPAGPPMLLGAVGSDANLHDVVEYVDGWMPVEGTEAIGERWTRLQRLALEAGRSPATLQLTIYGSSGSEELLTEYEHWGATRVVIGIAGSNQSEVAAQLDRHTPLVDRFASSP